jgi:flagellum-specific ATP synthase
LQAATRLREALALLKSSEDLIRIGAYAAGSNPKLEQVLRLEEEIRAFLRQRPEERSTLAETVDRMRRLAGTLQPAEGRR